MPIYIADLDKSVMEDWLIVFSGTERSNHLLKFDNRREIEPG